MIYVIESDREGRGYATLKGPGLFCSLDEAEKALKRIQSQREASLSSYRIVRYALYSTGKPT